MSCSVFAAALGTSGIADACSLESLLRLPFERLLELRINAAHGPRSDAGRATPAARPAVMGGHRA